MPSAPLSPDVLARLTAYVAANLQTPEAYIIDVLQGRDVVLLGEDHAIRHNLQLVHALIPLLYRAGVFTLGMEFGASEDQEALDALVTAEHYDEDAARRLMFSYNVGWAFREYMEIYRVAWALNRTLPASARPFRILNLSYRYNWTDAPPVRTPANARTIYPRGPIDAYRADIVRREILERDEKIVILTGTVHAFTRYHIPEYDMNAEGFVRFESRNLGQLLFRDAPERVFCILLHQAFNSQWYGGALRVAPAGGAIEQVMARFPNTRVGIDLRGPLGDLPDDSYYATGATDFRLSDLADGYIYERPFAAFESCELDEAFLTEENWPVARAALPDPQWHATPRTLPDYWAQIRAYADVPSRYRDVAG